VTGLLLEVRLPGVSALFRPGDAGVAGDWRGGRKIEWGPPE
jgi:hypothetical protein